MRMISSTRCEYAYNMWLTRGGAGIEALLACEQMDCATPELARQRHAGQASYSLTRAEAPPGALLARMRPPPPPPVPRRRLVLQAAQNGGCTALNAHRPEAHLVHSVEELFITSLEVSPAQFCAGTDLADAERLRILNLAKHACCRATRHHHIYQIYALYLHSLSRYRWNFLGVFFKV